MKSHHAAGQFNLHGKKSVLLSCRCCEVNNWRDHERDKQALREVAQYADEQAWKCASCNTMIEDGQKAYCRTCESYWNDVKNGLFSDY